MGQISRRAIPACSFRGRVTPGALQSAFGRTRRRRKHGEQYRRAELPANPRRVVPRNSGRERLGSVDGYERSGAIGTTGEQTLRRLAAALGRRKIFPVTLQQTESRDDGERAVDARTGEITKLPS